MIKETITGIAEAFNQSTVGTIFWLIMSITGAYKLIKEFVLDFAEFIKQLHKIGIRDILIITAFTLIMLVFPLIFLTNSSLANSMSTWLKGFFWFLIIVYVATVWLVGYAKFLVDDIDMDKLLNKK